MHNRVRARRACSTDRTFRSSIELIAGNSKQSRGLHLVALGSLEGAGDKLTLGLGKSANRWFWFRRGDFQIGAKAWQTESQRCPPEGLADGSLVSGRR